MSIGENIHRIRLFKGVFLHVLAEKADISKAAIINIEKGKNQPRVETIGKIAKALGVPMNLLFEDRLYLTAEMPGGRHE